MQVEKIKDWMWLAVLALVILVITALGWGGFEKKAISPRVLLSANALLFVLTNISMRMHNASYTTKNEFAFVRNVMGATVLKLLVIVAAIFIYFYASGELVNMGGIFGGMFMYIAYTTVEVILVLRRNAKRKNADL
ncbi:MAG TPA: hypothetical protein DIW54_10360 [Chitinophagaceae bacterium]|nr:hypothetical protein [Chitinophagaceae bacterium]HCT23696.1 hypothetical protein [Chitinophagaceae bacterium]